MRNGDADAGQVCKSAFKFKKGTDLSPSDSRPAVWNATLALTYLLQLGTMLVELLTGEHPFRGDSLLQTLQNVASVAIPLPLIFRTKFRRN